MRRSASKDYIYFDTTARNPIRLKHLLRIAKPYEGKVLTNDLSEEIVKDLIKYKWFEPETSLKVANKIYPELNLLDKFSGTKEFTDEEAWILINAWKPDHAESGFRGKKGDPHWAARWVTYYRECLVYGLINYTPPGKGKDLDKFAEPFFITELGNMLIDSISENESADTKAETSTEEQIVFSHIMAKFRSGNPIRRCSYEISPFPLLLKTLLLMIEDPDMKSYLGKDETTVLLTLRENDPYKLKEALKKFRESIPLNANASVIDRYTRREVANSKGTETLNLWSKSANMNSARDALWRRFRATGLFLLDKTYSLSLDLNQKSLINYIIDNYLDNKIDISTEKNYFSYIRSIDENLLKFQQEVQLADQTKLEKIAQELTWDEIKKELENCDDHRDLDGTIGPIKEIKRSLRYEFIIAVAITKQFKNTKVNARCRIDSFGWPIGHAPGQTSNTSGADIECFENNFNFIVEPSIGQSESWQLTEGINLDAHLKKFISMEGKPAKGFFISPSIKQRVQTAARIFADEAGESIMKNLTTSNLIFKLENESNLEDCFNNAP